MGGHAKCSPDTALRDISGLHIAANGQAFAELLETHIGHWLDFVMDLSPYSAPFTQIGRMRSAGITDLQHGTITGGAHEHVRLPPGVQCYALAATLGARRGLLSERLVCDGLVPLDSALGRHGETARTLHFPKDRRWVGYGKGHLELLNRPEAHSQLHAWMREAA